MLGEILTMKQEVSDPITFKDRFPNFWYVFCITLVGQIVFMFSEIDHDDSPGIGMIGAPITLPIGSAITAGIAVLFCKWLGSILKKTPLSKIWEKLGYGVLLITVASLLCLIFSDRLGLNQTHTDYKGTQYSTINDIYSLICYFLVVFPIVNLPCSKKKT